MIRNQKAFVITGAPGSGKSSLLKLLSENGMACIDEPAREIIAQQRKINGQGIYDRNPFLFKELMLSRAIQQYDEALQSESITIFDRGIPDLIAYSQCFDLSFGAEMNAAELYRYNQKVFFAPSWAKIFQNDDERKLTFDQSCQFGENLRLAYQRLGYEIVQLPCDTPAKRVEFILYILNSDG